MSTPKDPPQPPLERVLLPSLLERLLSPSTSPPPFCFSDVTLKKKPPPPPEACTRPLVLLITSTCCGMRQSIGANTAHVEVESGRVSAPALRYRHCLQGRHHHPTSPPGSSSILTRIPSHLSRSAAPAPASAAADTWYRARRERTSRHWMQFRLKCWGFGIEGSRSPATATNQKLIGVTLRYAGSLQAPTRRLVDATMCPLTSSLKQSEGGID
jgi:hypothetical protein